MAGSALGKVAAGETLRIAAAFAEYITATIAQARSVGRMLPGAGWLESRLASRFGEEWAMLGMVVLGVGVASVGLSGLWGLLTGVLPV